MWNLESQNTPQRALETVDYSLLCQRSKGNQFPTRPLMFLRGPVLYPLLHDWLYASTLFVVYD